MTLAFLILAHKNPRQIARLAHALRAPGHQLFIHVDARNAEAEQLMRDAIGNDGAVSFVKPRVACRWGTYSLIEATLNGLRAMRDAGVQADHVVLMSGQDYPLVSNAEMDAFFARHRGIQFIECFALDQPNRWTPHGGRFQSSARIEWFHIALRSRWFSVPVRRRMPHGLRGYGGSQWWALSGECVEGLLEMLEAQPAIERFFRNVFIPDESLIHTLVMNSLWRNSVDGRHLRYVDFTRANPLPPAVLMAGDIETMYAEPDALFARKFDMDRDAKVLDLIDERRSHTPANPIHRSAPVGRYQGC